MVFINIPSKAHVIAGGFYYTEKSHVCYDKCKDMQFSIRYFPATCDVKC